MSPSIDSFTTFSEVTLQNDYRTLSFTPTSRIIAQTRETPRKSEQIAKKQKVKRNPTNFTQWTEDHEWSVL